jgi:hypothetical protein
MLATLPVAGGLPASKTHAARRFAWVPSRDCTLPALGTLTIAQGRDLDSYSVDVEDGGEGFHEVLFVNKDATGEVYAVTCSPAGRVVDCTCPGRLFGRRRGVECKHMDATRELIAVDVLHIQPAA